jgi:hypothetical protein
VVLPVPRRRSSVSTSRRMKLCASPRTDRPRRDRHSARTRGALSNRQVQDKNDRYVVFEILVEPPAAPPIGTLRVMEREPGHIEARDGPATNL